MLLLKSYKVPETDGSQGYKAVVQGLEVIPAWKTITLNILQVKLEEKKDFFINSQGWLANAKQKPFSLFISLFQHCQMLSYSSSNAFIIEK